MKQLLAAALFITTLASCTTDRYLGSVGRTAVYSNRGYGLTVNMQVQGLEHRWDAIDPENPEETSRMPPVEIFEGLIDVNGDGELGLGEDVGRYLRPTLRLYSKTSTAAVMDVDVEIVGGPRVQHSSGDLFRAEVARLMGTATSSTPLAIQKGVAGPDYFAMTAEFPMGRGGRPEYQGRLTMIDQPHFAAETGDSRRQVVYILLRAPTITTSLRADHQYLVRGLILSKVGAPPNSKERW